MPSRRPLTHPLALSVLAQLSVAPRHPYALGTRRLPGRARSIPSRGALYAVIAALERDGLIRAVEVTRAGRRPARTVYAVTAEGAARLAAGARALIAVPALETGSLEQALAVGEALPPEAVLPLLEVRLRALAERQAETMADTAQPAHGSPAQRIGARYRAALLEAEARTVVEWRAALLASGERRATLKSPPAREPGSSSAGRAGRPRPD